LEVEGTVIFQKTGNHPHNNAASHCTGTESSTEINSESKWTV